MKQYWQIYMTPYAIMRPQWYNIGTQTDILKMTETQLSGANAEHWIIVGDVCINITFLQPLYD